MRHFIYFSRTAQTSGNFDIHELQKAGRMDIAVHNIIQAFFLSRTFREDVRLHMIFYGMPDPPKHLEMQVTPDLEISKKDVASLIKKMLYKYKEGRKVEVFPKCFIEKKSLLKVIEELKKEGNEIYILDKEGEDIRTAKIGKEPSFIFGDHKGLPKKELKRLKQMATPVSVGPKMYFASQVVVIVNNELDRRED
ncbi:MAG: tRNA (pseudouridine(54)-N(1))-methyltransferase TrmY [archaeon]|nr:tRNA (pseudouridine(54)-N(1))-methyltransferase TrmY [archaeon]